VRPAATGDNGPVPGAVLIVLILVVVGPILWWVVWGLMSFVLGWLLQDNAETTHAGSELIDTNY
jgi:hypothetical protein